MLPIRTKFFESQMGRLLLQYERDKEDNPIAPSPHSLSGKLVVSLTSYKPRFQWLHLTLKSLLEQTVIPDAIALWIAESEVDDLPESVLSLKDRVAILPTADLKSYKKIIPTLARYPGAHVVVCDDDIYYPREWLAGLVSGVEECPDVIVARSVHRFHYLSEGRIAPYAEWSFDVQDDRARVRSLDIVPVGVGGVLYPPNSLHADVCDVSLFTSLCPSNDDLWLYVMSRLNGYLPIKVCGKLHPIYWPSTQDIGLFRENMYRNDDVAIDSLIRHYGAEVFGVETREAR
jgi:hypothetical protein